MKGEKADKLVLLVLFTSQTVGVVLKIILFYFFVPLTIFLLFFDFFLFSFFFGFNRCPCANWCQQSDKTPVNCKLNGYQPNGKKQYA